MENQTFIILRFIREGIILLTWACLGAYLASLLAQRLPERQQEVEVHMIHALVELKTEPKTIEAPEEEQEEISRTADSARMAEEEETSVSSSGTVPGAGCLTRSKGVAQGPSGKETWYNLPMDGVIKIMRGMGYSEEEYPYRVREDGCKMLGDYIMVGACFDIRPRGTLIETSLGMGIVCDTGAFAATDQTQLDIAVNW